MDKLYCPLCGDCEIEFYFEYGLCLNCGHMWNSENNDIEEEDDETISEDN